MFVYFNVEMKYFEKQSVLSGSATNMTHATQKLFHGIFPGHLKETVHFWVKVKRQIFSIQQELLPLSFQFDGAATTNTKI